MKSMVVSEGGHHSWTYWNNEPIISREGMFSRKCQIIYRLASISVGHSPCTSWVRSEQATGSLVCPVKRDALYWQPARGGISNPLFHPYLHRGHDFTWLQGFVYSFQKPVLHAPFLTHWPPNHLPYLLTKFWIDGDEITSYQLMYLRRFRSKRQDPYRPNGIIMHGY